MGSVKVRVATLLLSPKLSSANVALEKLVAKEGQFSPKTSFSAFITRHWNGKTCCCIVIRAYDGATYQKNPWFCIFYWKLVLEKCPSFATNFSKATLAEEKLRRIKGEFATRTFHRTHTIHPSMPVRFWEVPKKNKRSKNDLLCRFGTRSGLESILLHLTSLFLI